jgi:hypothetical protein
MRRPFFISILCAASIVGGCKSENDDSSVKETLNKPSVAIVPLIDNSEHSLGWNLSDELTYTLCSKLDEEHLFNLALPNKIRAQSRRMKNPMNPFGDDLSWVKKTFAEEEFVVFMEMIEHSETPNVNPNEKMEKIAAESLSAQLNLAVRLRIIDNRGEQPKITLQEILQDSHFIPRQFTQYNFHQSLWTTEEFAFSPTGIAHAQLVKDLKSRIADYILIAKKEGSWF